MADAPLYTLEAGIEASTDKYTIEVGLDSITQLKTYNASIMAMDAAARAELAAQMAEASASGASGSANQSAITADEALTIANNALTAAQLAGTNAAAQISTIQQNVDGIDSFTQQIRDDHTALYNSYTAAFSGISTEYDIAISAKDAALAAQAASELAYQNITISASNADDSAFAAAGYAELAQASQTAAGNSASVATAAVLTAQTHAANGEASAIAAVNSASAAAASETAAGTSATAATTERLAAETARSAAEVFSLNAATAESNADGSANAAAISANTATVAANDVIAESGIVQSALADVEGNISAMIAFRVKAGTSGGDVELIAADNAAGGGAAANFRINADMGSSNFIAGVQGWQITKAGNAEFNNLINRNSIQNGEVLTGAIAGNAVTATRGTSGSGPQTLSFTSGASGGAMMIVASAQLSKNTLSGPVTATAQLKVNGGTVATANAQTVNYQDNGGTSDGSVSMVHTFGYGAQSFTIQLTGDVVSGSIIILERFR